MMPHDFILRNCAGLLVCALIYYADYTTAAVIIAGGITVSEILIYLTAKRLGVFGKITTDATLMLGMFFCASSTILYVLPAVYLASAPSVAMKITGLLWIIGVQIFVINVWTRIPPFLIVMLLPAMLIMVFAFLRLGVTPPEASSAMDWTFSLGFLVMFLYSTLDTLRYRFVTEAALLSAQNEAALRLTQLEESGLLDTLTGLLNRSAFDLALEVMLKDRNQNGGEIAVFLLDLDSFKPINDTYSHAAGDCVLVHTAERLKARIGQDGVVGRLGGDEFIIAVQGIMGRTNALALAADISKDISAPIRWRERTLKIGASIGIAMTGTCPSSASDTISGLCSGADQAMFFSKSSPNGEAILFATDLFAPRMTPENKQALIEGISSGALRPYYQPKIHLPTGKIIGFEALARWEHSDQCTRQPDEFLGQINELGLQGDFMVSMAKQVVRDVSAIIERGLDPGQVSLNVSEVALATHTGRQDLEHIIKNNTDVAKHLTFEITEDVFIARAADTIQAAITGFRDLGVRISLDDSGTGFASFHHLRQLDFDELKIDTTFVAGLGHDATAEVLVRGFLNIASGLGVSVIAEGVETEAQSRDLINMGCMTAQGFLFSAAVPLDLAIAKLVAQQSDDQSSAL